MLAGGGRFSTLLLEEPLFLHQSPPHPQQTHQMEALKNHGKNYNHMFQIIAYVMVTTIVSLQKNINTSYFPRKFLREWVQYACILHFKLGPCLVMSALRVLELGVALSVFCTGKSHGRNSVNPYFLDLFIMIYLNWFLIWQWPNSQEVC